MAVTGKTTNLDSSKLQLVTSFYLFSEIEHIITLPGRGEATRPRRQKCRRFPAMS